ncbi:hypothetical protein BCU68_03770 [Vibrio sp. 10N.286.49.B3]|nr:hypothetical protein BCU68_03770 [Vibrio sp. 10N.286.49.B3]
MKKWSDAKWNKLVNNALNPLGYYHPHILIDKTDKNLILTIDAGVAMRIIESDVVISGEAQFDQDFQQAVIQANLKVGQRLHHGRYDELKKKIQTLATIKGYFSSQFITHQLKVSPEANEASIHLHFNSGPRYYFGETLINNSQIELDRLATLEPYNIGDEFDTRLLGLYHSQLSQTGWFNSVLIEPNINLANENHEIPINVNLEPHHKNVVQVGGGVVTDIGLRASLRWTQPWYNTRGHSFESEAKLSKPEQSLQLGYKIPTLDVLNDYYAVQFTSSHVDYLDTRSFSSNLSFEKHWILTSHWESSVYLQYLYENYTQASDEDITQLLMPGISFTYTSGKEESKRLKHKHQLSIEYSNDHVISDIQLLRLQNDSIVARNFGNKQKIQFRTTIGINITDELSELPSSLRYFAGGDNNLRGYDYNSISPVDESGELTGALYLFNSGLDYQYNIYGAFWLGAFIDYGDAFDSKPDLKKGTGVSIERYSEIIPIKLDFAWGEGASGKDKFKLHFSLGAQF